jgi:hypothetical protein
MSDPGVQGPAKQWHFYLSGNTSQRQADRNSFFCITSWRLISNGFSSMQGCLSDALLDQWRAAIAEAITEMEAILVRQGLDLQNNDIFTFQEVAARGKHRFDLKLSVLDARFAVLMSQLDVAPWVSVIKLLLGEDVSRIASVIYSRPGADAQVRRESVACMASLPPVC